MGTINLLNPLQPASTPTLRSTAVLWEIWAWGRMCNLVLVHMKIGAVWQSRVLFISEKWRIFLCLLSFQMIDMILRRARELSANVIGSDVKETC